MVDSFFQVYHQLLISLSSFDHSRTRYYGHQIALLHVLYYDLSGKIKGLTAVSNKRGLS